MEQFVTLDAAKPTKYPRYWLKLNIGTTQVNALVDPGAARTVLGKRGREIAKKLGAKIVPSESSCVSMANGIRESVLGEIKASLTIGGICKEMQAVIIESSPTDLILGLDAMRKFGMIIDTSRDTYTLAGQENKEKFPFDVGTIETQEKYSAKEGLKQITKEESAKVKSY